MHAPVGYARRQAAAHGGSRDRSRSQAEGGLNGGARAGRGIGDDATRQSGMAKLGAAGVCSAATGNAIGAWAQQSTAGAHGMPPPW